MKYFFPSTHVSSQERPLPHGAIKSQGAEQNKWPASQRAYDLGHISNNLP